MSDQERESFAQRATDAVSRRSSLTALGGAALAAKLLAPMSAEAKDNKAKKAKKKAKKRCRKQQGQCEEAVQEFCQLTVMNVGGESANPEGIPNCVERFSECCPFFFTCKAREGVSCLLGRFLVN